MSPQITIKEIARQANVSIGTVDRVLHNRGRVAERTREKILKIVEEGNYSSNIYARNLKLNKGFNIMAVLPMRNAYWYEVSTGIKDGVNELAPMGISSQEFVLNSQSEKTVEKILEEVIDQKPDGLIFGPSLVKSDNLIFEQLDASKIPYVFVDAHVRGVNNLSFIGQDSFRSGVMAGRLLDKTYSSDFEIYVITFEEKDLLNTTVSRRIEGLKAFYSNKPQVIINSINLTRDNLDVNELKATFSKASKPVHILVPNSNSCRLAHELSDIREDIQLRFVGFDLIDENRKHLFNGVIDYIIDQNPHEQGNLAVQTLYRHIVLKNQVPDSQHLPIKVVTKENLEL